MAVNNFKCDYLMPQHFKGLMAHWQKTKTPTVTMTAVLTTIN